LYDTTKHLLAQAEAPLATSHVTDLQEQPDKSPDNLINYFRMNVEAFINKGKLDLNQHNISKIYKINLKLFPSTLDIK
jgi:hypothetical protein